MTSKEPNKLEPLNKIETIEMMIDSNLQSLHKDLYDFFDELDEGDQEVILRFTATLLRVAYAMGLKEGSLYPRKVRKTIREFGFRMED